MAIVRLPWCLIDQRAPSLAVASRPGARRRPVAVIGEVETDRDGATRVVFTPDAAPR
jgi:hypothetical protein